MVYAAILSVAQPEHGGCDMLGKISGVNSLHTKTKENIRIFCGIA